MCVVCVSMYVCVCVCLHQTEEDDLSDVCPVCQCPFETNDVVTQTSCRHNFHLDCLLPWLEKRRTCPICRADLVVRTPQAGGSGGGGGGGVGGGGGSSGGDDDDDGHGGCGGEL
jgi:hypothetical protein